MFSGGFAGISVLSYYLPDWQNLTLAIAALAAVNILFRKFISTFLSLTLILSVPFLPESPRFLVTKGRYEEAQVILDRFASEASEPDDEPLLAPDISLFVIEKPGKAPPVTEILFSAFFGKGNTFVNLFISINFSFCYHQRRIFRCEHGLLRTWIWSFESVWKHLHKQRDQWCS